MKQILLLLVLPILVLGCTASKTVNDDLKLEIITRKMDSWVNLMPGSKPSFFISSSVKIKNNENSVIDSVRMLKCNVIQDEKILYELHPEFNYTDDVSESILPGKERIYSIHLSRGEPINKELNIEKPVSVDLYLTAPNGIKHHKIDSINVTKAY